MLKAKKKQNLIIFFAILLILVFGIWLRYKNIEGYNIVFDYDQYEDQFYTYTLAVDKNPAIIGRAIYGDPRLHHGVFYYYYNLLPFLLSGGNILVSAYWNIVFNAATAVILFIFAKVIFKKNLPAFISAVIATSSFEFIKFSSWLTIDTVAIFLVPLFFFGLWSYFLNKKWGLILSSVALGLSIQSDLSFLYLIPTGVIYWVILKPKIPDPRLLLLSILYFLATISTLILTEIKLNFSGLKTLLNFSTYFNEASRLSYAERLNFFFEDFVTNFSNNLLPQRPNLGIYITLSILLAILYLLYSKKTPEKEKRGVYFLLLYLFAPATTLLIGYHDKPWFLIGLPPAIALVSGYVISKLNIYLIIPILILIIGSNTNFILQRPNDTYKLFDNIYDATSYLKYQLQVVDYTYQQAKEGSFSINAVTYPLYYNGMWAYLYNWYGKERYGYLPGWLGGDQLHPYDLLPKTDNGKIFYMIISETPRIPDIYKNKGRIWAVENGELIEEKNFPGFSVMKMKGKDEI